MAASPAITRSNWYGAQEQVNLAISDQVRDNANPCMRRLADVTSTLFFIHTGQAGGVARMIRGEFLAPHMNRQMISNRFGAKCFPDMEHS